VTIEFHCPHCDKLLKTPDDKAGVRANCPGCGQIVTIPDLVAEAAQVDPSFAVSHADSEISPPQAPVAAAEEGEVVESDLQHDMKPCPMCGAAIKKAAIRCRYCGETLERGASRERVPTKIEAGEILSHAWEIYKDQVGLLVGAIVVVGVINFAIAMVGSAIQQVALLGAAGPGGRGGNPFAMGIGAFGLTILFQLISYAVNAYLQAGLHVLMLRVARREGVDFVVLFSGGRFFWRYFWGTLLFNLMVAVGFVLLIVPGIILALMFWPIYFVIVDRDTGVFESLRLASELTTGNYLAAFVLFLAVFGLQLLGIFPGLCIGLLFTAPLGELLWAVAYLGMNGQLALRGRE
jgi:phage FluMu protein Com